MAEKRMMACDVCGAYQEVQKNTFMGWSKVVCACGHKYSYDDKAEKLICKCCGKPVFFTKEHKETCPHCSKPLAGVVEEVLTVGCPGCSIPLVYEKGCKELTCPHCKSVFNPETKILVERAIVENVAPDIRMTGTLAPDHMIWKHPLEQMPITTSVIAKPGMLAVLMQGTTMVGTVTGSSLKLSETSLRNDAADYEGGSAPMTYVDVYYIRQNINQRIAWGSAVTLTDSYGITADFSMTGDIDIDQVTDPAAFLQTFGFDPEMVKHSRFGMTGRDGGPGDFALKVRERARSVLPHAMESVRDRYDYNCENILDHKAEILEEMLRQANLAVAEYGVSLSNMHGTFSCRATREPNILEVRTRGRFDWKLAREVMVHPWDDPAAQVGLRIAGTFYMDVLDLDKFRTCREANEWRNRSRSDSDVREEISRFVAERLQGRFLADIQNLIDKTKCDLASLEGFSGGLLIAAESALNQADGFFGSRGLRVRDTTMSIVLGAKSDAFRDREQLQNAIREEKRDEELGKIDLKRYGREKVDARNRLEIDTDNAVHEIGQSDRVIQAQHASEMKKAQMAEERAAQERAFGYEAWKAKQRMQREQEEADYERARRAQLARQEEELTQSQHEERMFAIAQRIENSKLSWREKLDAYARLQRGMIFRDQLDEKEAAAEAAIREERLHNELAAEERRVMIELQHQEEQLAEDLTQQRFAREMELRRQRASEEAAQLKAQYDLECKAAEAEEKRAQAREEIETLRLMLEYLVENGQQQVTAEALREAQASARADWERDHQAAELAAAEQRHKKQLEDERALHQRAMTLMQEMTVLRDETKNQQGQKAADIAGLQSAIAQLDGICAGLKAGGMAPAQPAQTPNDAMNNWFNSIVSRAPQANAYAPQPAYAPRPAAGGSIIVCASCHKPFNLSDYMCPNCGWRP